MAHNDLKNLVPEMSMPKGPRRGVLPSVSRRNLDLLQPVTIVSSRPATEMSATPLAASSEATGISPLHRVEDTSGRSYDGRSTW